MNLLLTGALGFLGLNLTRSLASRKSVRVVAADVRQPTAEQVEFLQPVAASVSFCSLDICRRQALRELLEERQITHVVHAAALTPTFTMEREQPTRIVDVNLGGTLNLLDAALYRPSLRRVIVVSSSGVYGASPATASANQTEDGPLLLDDLYSITKRSAELLTQRYGKLSGISMVTVRLAALYGPLERASASRPRISAIGQLNTALKEAKAVRVAGPSVRRDWTYVEDAASALFALLEAVQLRHAVYNVSCGLAVPFERVVAAFVAHGLEATWSRDVSRADVLMHPSQERMAMSIARLQSDTAYVPRFDIESGIAAYLNVSR